MAAKNNKTSSTAKSKRQAQGFSRAKQSSGPNLSPGEIKKILEDILSQGSGLLICADRLRRERALQFLLQHETAQGLQLRRLSSDTLDEKSLATLAAHISQGSLFAPRELLLFQGVEKLKAQEARGLLEILENYRGQNILLCLSQELPASHVLAKHFASKGLSLHYPELAGEMFFSWIARELAREHIEAKSRQVIEHLASVYQGRLDSFAQCIAQISLFLPASEAGKMRSLSLEELHSFCEIPASANEYALQEKMLDGRLLALEQDAEALHTSGKNQFYLLALLQRGIGQVFALRAAQERGLAPQHAAAQMGINPWALRHILPLLGKHRASRLLCCLHELLRLDFQLKDKNFGPGNAMSSFFAKVQRRLFGRA